MDRRERRREVLKLLLGAVGFALAILIGFGLGLRVGGSRQPSGAAGADSTAVSTALPPADSIPAPPEPEPQVDTLQSKITEIGRKEVARAAEYLTTHNRWNRDEMEQYPAMQGLWDAVNTYNLEEIIRYNEIIDCPPLATIIEGLQRSRKKGYYASKKDRVITLSTYAKRLGQ